MARSIMPPPSTPATAKGLNPEDNAGVLLMQAFGGEAVPEANRERFYKALGIAVPAGNQSTMQDLGQIVKQHLEEKGVASDDNASLPALLGSTGTSLQPPLEPERISPHRPVGGCQCETP